MSEEAKNKEVPEAETTEAEKPEYSKASPRILLGCTRTYIANHVEFTIIINDRYGIREDMPYCHVMDVQKVLLRTIWDRCSHSNNVQFLFKFKLCSLVVQGRGYHL